MIAEDLQIGNWICQKGGIQFQVTVDAAEAPDFWRNNLEICQGLPITEDWLVKFGFEDNSLKVTHYSFLRAIELNDGKREVRLVDAAVGNSVSRYVTEVHQLQNLFHALTGKKLTIKDPAV